MLTVQPFDCCNRGYIVLGLSNSSALFIVNLKIEEKPISLLENILLMDTKRSCTYSEHSCDVACFTIT